LTFSSLEAVRPPLRRHTDTTDIASLTHSLTDGRTDGRTSDDDDDDDDDVDDGTMRDFVPEPTTGTRASGATVGFDVKDDVAETHPETGGGSGEPRDGRRFG